MIRQLTIIETKPGWYEVYVGDNYANMLGIDEAIGAVASWLFTNKTLFVRTPDHNIEWMLKYRVQKPTQPDPPLQLPLQLTDKLKEIP